MRQSIPATNVGSWNIAMHVMGGNGAFDPKRVMTYRSLERKPMRRSTNLEEIAPRGVSRCSDTPIVILRRGPAGNDATCEDPAISKHQAARADRSFMLGELIVAAIQAAGAIARRAHARHRQRRQARALYDTLRHLDDHILRDLGVDRSEIRSVAADVTGEARYTHVRAPQKFTFF